MPDTARPPSKWIPLHVHTQYSILDASAPIPAIAARAAEFGMSAAAITDHGNLFGAIEFYKSCKSAGVKPIIGCELYVAPGSRLEKKREYGVPTSYTLTLLAKNHTGYVNLCKLSSLGYLEGFYYTPRVDRDSLRAHSDGLICLSGCLHSHLSNAIVAGNQEEINSVINWHKEVFGADYYFELMRHSMSDEDLHADGMFQETWLYQRYQEMHRKQELVNETLIRISKERGIPLVATNDSHYLNRNDWQAHEILLNIQSGEPCEIWENDQSGIPKFRVPNPKRTVYPSHEFYFKSPEQMEALFKDIPEALSNTIAIAEKCSLAIDFDAKHYPVYIPPSIEGRSYTDEERASAVESYLRELCEKGIPLRYTPERLNKVKELFPDKDPMAIVRDRLELEMSVIAPKGMCDYLLIVWDFINWAKNHDIPVGPGRGSGAGSIVLYLIGITDIEPLRFHLFFERFINPERISYPDIDVDICMERRDEVIQYTLNKYGKDNVAQIITFLTMKAKTTIKDVGRVLSVPLTKVNAIAKLVPEDLNITLEEALKKDADLLAMYQSDEDAKRIIDIGKSLEGSVRSSGIHAAGIIISGEPLTNHVPICLAKDAAMPVTQFSMKPVEQVGMLKVDFLGLKTLTAIRVCVNLVKENTGNDIDWMNLPLDDKPTFELLNQGKTMGVFQLESSGMQDLARQLHLDKFEEIIAVSALYRPGPMDMIPSFINRKHGREKIEYDHPWMKDILAETYGIMVYQEQVMQIAQKLANYSLGEGDVLRRAMGKKDHDQMNKERKKFVDGALENGINESVSGAIFDKMEKFASYGFNKSHAAAYSYIAYVTAYLKAHYPREWMCALMTCDSTDISKLGKFIREAKAMDIPMLSPDVNEAESFFAATPAGIRFAMSGIKGIGENAVDAIVSERKAKGRYKSLYDFCKRVDHKKVGKKVIESLVDAGGFDFTGWSRDALRTSIEPMFETAAKEQKDHQLGVLSLFSLLGDASEDHFSSPPVVTQPTDPFYKLFREKHLLGFFLTAHPMDAYKDILARLSCIPLRKIEELSHDAVFRSAFIVETVNVRFSSKTQKKFAIVTISDGIENYELPVWPEMYEEKGYLLKENQLLYAVLQVDKSQDSPSLNCRWLDDLTKANEAMIQACDQAYDKARQASARFSQYKKSDGPKQPPKQNPKPNAAAAVQPYQIPVDIDKTRLSHILQIKELIYSHPGTAPVQLAFYSGHHAVAVLHVDTKWKVSADTVLENKLKTLPFIRSIPS